MSLATAVTLPLATLSLLMAAITAALAWQDTRTSRVHQDRAMAAAAQLEELVAKRGRAAHEELRLSLRDALGQLTLFGYTADATLRRRVDSALLRLASYKPTDGAATDPSRSDPEAS